MGEVGKIAGTADQLGVIKKDSDVRSPISLCKMARARDVGLVNGGEVDERCFSCDYLKTGPSE